LTENREQFSHAKFPAMSREGYAWESHNSKFYGAVVAPTVMLTISLFHLFQRYIYVRYNAIEYVLLAYFYVRLRLTA